MRLNCRRGPQEATRSKRTPKSSPGAKIVNFYWFLNDFGLLAFSAFRHSKTAQEGSKSALRRPKRPPRGPQLGPSGPQDGPKGARDSPRESQDGPKRRPREGRGTDNSRLPPSWAPRRLQETPKRPQESPKRPQEAPKRPKRGPKTAFQKFQNSPPGTIQRTTTKSQPTSLRSLTHHPGTVPPESPAPSPACSPPPHPPALPPPPPPPHPPHPSTSTSLIQGRRHRP